MGVLRTLMRLPRKLKRIPRMLKRIPRALLRTPRRVARAARKFGDWVGSALGPLKLFPLDQFHGRCFAVAEVWLAAALLTAVSLLVARLGNIDPLASVTRPVLPVVGVGTALSVVVFLVVYPLDRGGYIEASLVRVGIRQRNRTSTGLVSGLVGLAVALVLAYVLGTGTGGGGPAPAVELEPVATAAVFLVGFVVTALSVYWVLQTNTESHYVRSELSVVEVVEGTDETVGVVIRNGGDDIVSLAKAKVEDSQGEEYELDNDISLRPGERRTLDLPADFELETTEYMVPTGLGMVYDEQRPVKIYARTGETFVLEWEG